MTTIYKVATGYNHASGAQTAIAPQPRTRGMQYMRPQYAASGIVLYENAFIEFLFSMVESASQYTSILTQFGVNSALTAAVSIVAEDDQYGTITRNGIAVRPFIGQDGQRENFFLRDFVILVKNLAAQP